MVVVWEGRTENAVSDALISQVDFFASIAALVNKDLDPDVAIDSLDLSRALLGEADGREWLFKESVGTVSLRWNDWKFIDPVGPEVQVPAWLPPKGIEGGLSREPQLFDLSRDVGEVHNVAADHEQVMAAMEDKLGVIRGKETSTGRVPQQ
jgi:arylsulfatase A